MPRSPLTLLALMLLTAPLVMACDHPSVLVVGLDGATWDVMDPLMEAGLLPAMRGVVERGVRGDYDCAPSLPSIACFCPPVWTSLFTGHLFAQHGITFDDQPPEERQVKAIWSVLRDYGGTSTALSLHNDWPPDPDFELLLTKVGVDFAASQWFAVWPPGLPLAAFVEEQRTSPPGLFETLGVLPHPAGGLPVWAPIARDRVAMETLRRLLRRRRTDLTLILLHSTDKVAHARWSDIQPHPGDPISEGTLLRQAEAWQGPHTAPGPWGWGTLVAPYIEIDRWLGELLDEFHFDSVVLVSDHGMTRRAGPGLSGDHGPASPAAHHGILAIRGRQVRRGRDFGSVEVTDFAPTLAYLLGLPIGDDLPGRVLEEVFVPGSLRVRPIQHVSSWESGPISPE